MTKLDAGNSPSRVDELVSTHAIDPATLRAGKFENFFLARLESLVAIIEKAMGKSVNRDWDEHVEDVVAQFDDTEDIAEEDSDEEQMIGSVN